MDIPEQPLEAHAPQQPGAAHRLQRLLDRRYQRLTALGVREEPGCTALNTLAAHLRALVVALRESPFDNQIAAFDQALIAQALAERIDRGSLRWMSKRAVRGRPWPARGVVVQVADDR